MLDSLSLKNSKLGLETLDLMDYRGGVRVLLNRADSSVGISREDVMSIIGRAPDVLVPSDRNITRSVNQGEPIALLHNFLPHTGVDWFDWLMTDQYIKAGKMFPAFGLRVHDDEAFIRARSGFTFQNPDDGGEIGIAPGPFFFASSITNGKPGDKDVQTTFNGYGVFEDIPVVRNVIAGASYARQSNKRDVSGFYAGSNIWKFTYLGELDIIDDRTVATRAMRDKFAAYGEVDLLLLDWLNLRGTFDFVKVTHNNDQTRYAIGAEPFISRVIQPRIQYRINNGPGSKPGLNQDELRLELHFFF